MNRTGTQMIINDLKNFSLDANNEYGIDYLNVFSELYKFRTSPSISNLIADVNSVIDEVRWRKDTDEFCIAIGPLTLGTTQAGHGDSPMYVIADSRNKIVSEIYGIAKDELVFSYFYDYAHPHVSIYRFKALGSDSFFLRKLDYKLRYSGYSYMVWSSA